MASKRSKAAVAVATAKARQRVADSRRRPASLCDSKSKNRAVRLATGRQTAILTSSRRLKVRGRVKTSVADATYLILNRANELPPPPGYELRLQLNGEQTTGGYWHRPSGRFVASWFQVLAVTNDAWLIAYVPPDCHRINAWLIPFSEAKRIPALLRKAGCRVGTARLLVEMMTGLVPCYPSS